MKPTIITLVLATLIAIGSAYWLDAGEPRKKPYPKPTPPPPASNVFTPATEPAPTAREIEEQARDNNANLALAIERALASRNPQQRETAFTFLLPQLLQLDPQRVTDMVSRQSGEARDALRSEVARQWISKDRDAAIRWMKSLESPERNSTAQVAVESLAAIAPDQAIYVADQFGIGRDNGYLEHLVQIWAEGDLHGAERWLASQPDDARLAPLRARIERVRDQKRAAARG